MVDWRAIAPWLAAMVLLAAAIIGAGMAGEAFAVDKPSTGDQRRSYHFDAAGQDMPYRMYVPSNYDGSRPYPLVVVLHGGGGDENGVFENSTLRDVAEARRVVLVAPLGYSRFGGFGDIYPVMLSKAVAQQARELKTRSAQAGAADKPGAPARPDQPAAPDDIVEVPANQLIEARAGQLSEQDVMNVVSRVEAEYWTDPRRVYLMGNSMGGIGTTYLAAKYPEVWAAIAPSDGPIAAAGYPFDRLRTYKVAALFIHGEKDEHANPKWSKALADAAQAEGVDARFLQVPGGSHVKAWTMVIPQTFDFLLAHTKPVARS